MAAAGPGSNPYASNRHADVLNETPVDEAAKVRLVEEIKNRAKGAFVQKDMPSAELLYGKAIEVLATMPGKADPLLFSNRAMVRLNLNKVDGALADANSCIEIDPKAVKAWHRKAQALVRLSEWDDAIKAAEAGAALDPDNKAFPELAEKARSDRAKDADDKAKLKRDAQDVRVELHNASTARAPPAASRRDAQAVDGDEDNSMRGYKKRADGKTTSYFHTDITDEAKRLIEEQGFGKPKKIEAAADLPSGEVAGGGSKWNQAGTYEEKGMMKWMEENLRKDLTGIEFTVPAGCGGCIKVVAVADFKGDASISCSRGKRRHLLDLSFEVSFEGTVGDSAGKGKLKYSEVSTDEDEPEVAMEVDGAAAPALREVFNTFVKPAGQGLQPLILKRLLAAVAEYKQQ